MSTALIRIYRELHHVDDIPLTEPIYSIGRGSGSAILLDDEGVSRRHALIRREGKAFRVEDRGTPNGTLHNGQRIRLSQPLQHGDRICIGRYTLIYLEGPGAALLMPPADSEGLHITWSSQEATSYLDQGELQVMRSFVALPVIEALDQPGQPTMTMSRDHLVLGCGPDVDLPARSLFRWPGHKALITRRSDRCQILRLSPLVSLRVNGQRCASAMLEDGDMIRVGRSRYVIHLPGRVRTPPPAAGEDEDLVVVTEDG